MLTQQRLQELLSYNPDTGLFLRIKCTSNNQKLHEWVGYIHDTSGYMYAMIDYKTYSIHHLAWLYCYGIFPQNELDHINGNKHDNRICNLRNADRYINMQNEVRPRKNSKSGILGVTFRSDRNKWIASIHINGRSGKRLHLGQFDTAEEAQNVYLEAKRKYHAGFNG